MSIAFTNEKDVNFVFKKYQLRAHRENTDFFLGINKLGGLHTLVNRRLYYLPIFKFKYNGKSVKETLGLDDWSAAEAIVKYNKLLQTKKVRPRSIVESKEIWVPYHLMKGQEIMPDPSERPLLAGKKPDNFPIFGKSHSEITPVSQKLKNHVYYIVSGHGGPDPGAIARKGKFRLHEDEYAYDIGLRLARNLISHGAKVYMIIRDPSDGIRETMYLKNGQNEKCWPSEEIPLDQLQRLKQRADAVNQLYEHNKANGIRFQRVLMLHLDSRPSNKRIDMFFYHAPKSLASKKFATSLQQTIKKKYRLTRKNKHYTGVVKGRDLYMLRKTKPIAVYAELGNLQNTQDQKRFLPPNNRQAIANWLTAGLLKKE
ncbi:MAG: N-acetylmuramoyl-L-alanine amidase [Cytophagales bacterium]|nr:N-acetylmuramoyl-L-alanine amidase [Cytophagales bacterium]